jgi:pyridoxamine 5'-phosphate oxidase
VRAASLFHLQLKSRIMEKINEQILKLRHDFTMGVLDEKDVDTSPFVQFGKWFEQALSSQVNEPNAMMLATVGKDQKPSARVLLLRNFSEKGFVFYTNYHSHKGVQTTENPCAAMTFFWPELQRQVRIEGSLVKQSPEDSDLYFAARPRESKIGAWVSPQSQVIADRKALDEKFAEMEKKFGEEVPRPAHWGGYVLQPESIEFWQGRAGRLHDRIRYRKTEEGWKAERLAP